MVDPNGANYIKDVIPNPPWGTQMFVFRGESWVSNTYAFGSWTNPYLSLRMGEGMTYKSPIPVSINVTGAALLSPINSTINGTTSLIGVPYCSGSNYVASQVIDDLIIPAVNCKTIAEPNATHSYAKWYSIEENASFDGIEGNFTLKNDKAYWVLGCNISSNYNWHHTC